MLLYNKNFAFLLFKKHDPFKGQIISDQTRHFSGPPFGRQLLLVVLIVDSFATSKENYQQQPENGSG